MSIDIVKKNHQDSVTRNIDITWKKLINDSETEIKTCKDKISKLRKSIGFFKKQDSLGIEFPRLNDKT